LERNGKSLAELPIMSIHNPTLSAAADLAHFRHFSSLYTNFPSTTVESALQITPFYAKQSQFSEGQKSCKFSIYKELRKFIALCERKNKPNSKPIQTQFNPIQSQFKPKQTQFKPNIEEQRKSWLFGNQSSLIDNHLEGKSQQIHLWRLQLKENSDI